MPQFSQLSMGRSEAKNNLRKIKSIATFVMMMIFGHSMASGYTPVSRKTSSLVRKRMHLFILISLRKRLDMISDS